MGDDDVTATGPIRATWASIEPSVDTMGDLARFAVGHQLRDVFLVVPWEGDDDEVRRAAADLGGEGVSVSAVASDPRWATDPRPFMQWIRRIRTAGGAAGRGRRAGVTDEGGFPVDEGATGERMAVDRPDGADGGDASDGGIVFSGVHLDVEPWRLPVWDRDRARATRGLVDLVRRARTLAPDLPLSADLPHWLAAEPYWSPTDWPPTGEGSDGVPTPSSGWGRTPTSGRDDPGATAQWEEPGPRDSPGRPRIRPTGRREDRVGGSPTWPTLPGEPGMPHMRIREPARVAAPGRSRTSVFEAVLAHLDSVTILVPRTRAHGQGGILDVSAKARASCVQRGVPYMIGLETRPTTDPRRPRATFHDRGAVALARESERLREALGTDQLFLGVAVHDWSAWSVLS